MGCIAKGPRSAADTWSESYKFTSFTRHNWACLVKVRMQKARLRYLQIRGTAKSHYVPMTFSSQI